MKTQTWVSPLPPDFSDSVNLGGPRTCISNEFSGDTDATRPRNHTGAALLHGSGLFVSTGFPSPVPLVFFPGMSLPPPCTPQPILWALPVNTLPVKAEFSAISSGQLFPVLPERLCLPPWARTHGAQSRHQAWGRCPGHRDVRAVALLPEDTHSRISLSRAELETPWSWKLCLMNLYIPLRA